ncbi:MAG: carbamoyltransferase HypF [Candidatus Bathyarchaeota archaeon]|nr:carbamoyltransferase HypF [Candidatus Bathyarchaeota archaeon]
MSGLRVKVNVNGIVQGVGFRPFVYRIAVKNGLEGYVRNLGDAGVEILLEGTPNAVDHFLAELQEQKPPLSQIYEIQKTPLTGKNEHSTFTIIPSSDALEHSGSVVPPDSAICNDCLRELRDPNDPRFDYFFITCVNCGPRFTIVERLPYDRENTTMQEFPLCGLCTKEYDDPLNRRFHAQTVACPTCGPKAYLTNNKGEPVNAADAVREAGRLLSEGSIVAVKGYGGFHIAASAVEDAPLVRLREAKHRRAKPFALMARSLAAIRGFAEVPSKEQELLSSPARPIVLLSKNGAYGLSPLVAPDLHNVGVMLPYSAMHYMLFDQVGDAAFVMTSANPANQPIVNDNAEAIRILGGTVDYFLFHNRKIAHRCDDSVTRVHQDRNSFIRRSRGYAPAPVRLKQKAKRCVVGLGGELNNTSCVLNENKAFISQHIGDVENLETHRFLQDATQHLIRLTNSKIEAVACDLHPKFTTTHLARQLAEQNGWEFLQVQHHHAHVAALMAEHGVDELVGVACDGYGYGADGSAWGGEILFCSRSLKAFKRLGHLEAQPLLGGDVATRYPLRIAAGILSKKSDGADWLMQNSKYLPHGTLEAELILSQLRKPKNIPQTTSLGRVFDAAAAVLGLCYERTYEGEAAMKLESAAVHGKDVLELTFDIRGDRLGTTYLLSEIFQNRNRFSKSDLAYSVHAYLAKGLATLATEKAVALGVGSVGFTGGSAVNALLAKLMRETVEAHGMRFLVHEAVPAGDGGVSFGQAFVGGFWGF